MADPKVVAAVAAMAGPSPMRRDPALAARIEAAMSAAVQACLDTGVDIQDSVAIKAAMMQARAKVLREAGLPLT